MLRMFLGRSGLEDLALPVRLPWATALVVPRNLLAHHVMGRTAWGERRLVRRGEEARARIERLHFGHDVPQVAPIPPSH
jgi:hypothetical protein